VSGCCACGNELFTSCEKREIWSLSDRLSSCTAELYSGVFNMNSLSYIQGDARGNVNIVGGCRAGHSEKKTVHMNVYLILNCYRDITVLNLQN